MGQTQSYAISPLDLQSKGLKTTDGFIYYVRKVKKCKPSSTGSNQTILYQFMKWNMLFTLSKMAISNSFHSLGRASAYLVGSS